MQQHFNISAITLQYHCNIFLHSCNAEVQWSSFLNWPFRCLDNEGAKSFFLKKILKSNSLSQKYEFFFVFSYNSVWTSKLESSLDMYQQLPPSTDPVPPSTNKYRPLLTQYHHVSTSTAMSMVTWGLQTSAQFTVFLV